MTDHRTGPAALIIRTASREDLPAILAMLAEDTLPADRETDPADPRYLAAFDAIDADPHQLLVAAELNDQVIGTLQLSFFPGLSFRGAWRGQIEAVRIASNLRGRRYGEQLIAWAVERCRERDCFLVQLTSSNERTDAHRFYERLGWAKSHTGSKLKLKDAQ
ncbi:GNAT family N-acetyltransferase [Sphingomonas xinjiangensis]|uniref:GNAT superfamily N-acetyltransferase n=1 Tax=Sphingomonas xinjiangensis TaxID=643568 RepID=A0A840YP71_9SPHN|nr:GNAT family N-acetyltransferase [Sphingomonas xinjiangensis]MBB5709512.1 GNAT superfamily N-acetyltransferase [Sphingomonas xinjiangensis]